jgi:type III secretion system FlhB-like substrate exporter
MNLSPQAIELLEQTVAQSNYPGQLAEVVVEVKQFLLELKKDAPKPKQD